jgi:hypothetical protein
VNEEEAFAFGRSVLKIMKKLIVKSERTPMARENGRRI